MNENELKQNSIKTFQFKNRKKSSNFIAFSKNSEILSKNMNNKLFVTKNMLDIRLRNIANTLLCPRAFTLSSDFKSANNTAILLNNSMKTYKILICDDDRLTALSTQNSILKYFKSSNNNKNPPDILLAQNGIECLYIIYSNYIKENAVNLLLIDKNMPFIDGITTSTLIKNVIELSNIKIYILSSEIVNLDDCKVDGYYDKPLTNEALNKILFDE
jgi:CheY-like chemotaxis protein